MDPTPQVRMKRQKNHNIPLLDQFDDNLAQKLPADERFPLLNIFSPDPAVLPKELDGGGLHPLSLVLIGGDDEPLYVFLAQLGNHSILNINV